MDKQPKSFTRVTYSLSMSTKLDSYRNFFFITIVCFF
jgi:hypothetical protein